MKKIRNRLIALAAGITLGVTLIGSTIAFADPPCNHSGGYHPGSTCYYSSTVGSHSYQGQTCYIIEYLYHNYDVCDQCGAHFRYYPDTVKTVHSINHN